jgi:hypothetical protein
MGEVVKMKIRVTLDVTVDAERWEFLYGADPHGDESQDVIAYVYHQLLGSAAVDGDAITDVEIR